jgi:hypothetical protein
VISGCHRALQRQHLEYILTDIRTEALQSVMAQQRNASSKGYCDRMAANPGKS